jgi:hypothetical protein
MTLETTGSSVRVRWDKKPMFGPYILSGAPFYKDSYQCAGLYKKNGEKNKAYTSKRPEKLPQGGAFLWANKNPRACPKPIPTPWVSLIIWQDPKLSQKDRILLTQLLPRGSILRMGAMGMGDLLSAPIPRDHPGYQPRIPVRPYLGEEALPAHPTKPLRLFVQDSPGFILKKVVGDIYRSKGFPVEWTSTIEEAQGHLTSLYMPLPQLNYLGQTPQDWLSGDKDLAKYMAQYSLSLTEIRPDFALLKKIHERLFSLEPYSLLFQHQVCSSIALDVEDPDWFKKWVVSLPS